MPKTLTKVLLGVVASTVTTFFLATASWSMPGDGEGVRGPDPEHMVERLSKRLDLTDEQEATVLVLLTSAAEESGPDRERMYVLRGQLFEQPGAFDESTAQVTAHELGEVSARLAYRMASTRAAIYQLLDDEQKAVMAEMRERSGSHGKKRRGGDRLPF